MHLLFVYFFLLFFSLPPHLLQQTTAAALGLNTLETILAYALKVGYCKQTVLVGAAHTEGALSLRCICIHHIAAVCSAAQLRALL